MTVRGRSRRRPIRAASEGWIENVRAVPAADVAGALGLAVRDRGARPSFACPACGAERRGKGDHRGPAGVTADGGGWRCHRCQAGGSALDLAALALFGGRLASGDPEWPRLRAWCADQGWCKPDPRMAGPPLAELEFRVEPFRPAAPPAGAAPHRRLDPADVRAVWDACRPVTGDAAVAAWLRSRALDAGRVEDRDLARALPADLDAPPWARCNGRPWTDGWRCILPAYDARGDLAGLRARWTGDGDPPGFVPYSPGPKEAAPAGSAAGGLVYADALGLLLLRAGRPPDWWPAGRPLRAVVAEGAPDFLTWATWPNDAEEGAPAVFGVWAGAWTADVAARVPDRAVVTVRTHADAAGDRYAGAVCLTLAGRCTVLRPPGGTDAEAA